MRLLLGRLAVLLCQDGREEEATDLLKRGGWRYRLAPWVLRYPPPPADGDAATPSASSTASPEAALPPPSFLWVTDGSLPSTLLDHLRQVLAPQGPFWREHGYNEVQGSGETGYFSYVHPIEGEVTSSMDLIVRHVLEMAKPHFPALVEATKAEWWAHCRPHACGHQLHFDSDNEGIGGARHPICTAIAFLLAPGGLGGPTLVTDQRLEDKNLAAQGWLLYPKEGRLAVYDGSVLHGVVPGHGKPPPSAPADGRRVTFMVAFWRKIQTRPWEADGLAGSSRPLPDPSKPAEIGPKTYTWHQALALPAPNLLSGSTEPKEVVAKTRPGVWVPVAQGTEAEPADLPDYSECFQF